VEEYRFLLDIAIILFVTKGLSLFSKKISMPPVVGALIAGIVLGPMMLNLVQFSESLSNIAEVGVVVLMFQAGLETDVKELKRSGKAAFIIAITGVLIPMFGGIAVSVFYSKNIMQNVFIGVILTATSVSITVETLQEMGKLKGRVGTAILGAAIIDDILGIILLSIMTSIGKAGSIEVSVIFMIFVKMAAFFVISAIGGVIVYKFFKWMSEMKVNNEQVHRRRVPVFAFAFCLALAYLAEVFGIADITGAYLAGIILCRVPETFYIYRKIECLSYMLITPVFFASIGLKTDVSSMTSALLIFTILISLVAVITKIAGCGVGAKICKYTNRESVQIGAGMVCRGEVALIVAQKGISVGILHHKFFAPIVIMVLVTTLLSPILLKIFFNEKKKTRYRKEAV
jgi:Kef-type K+ transport system membrane component KefB